MLMEVPSEWRNPFSRSLHAGGSSVSTLKPQVVQIPHR